MAISTMLEGGSEPFPVLQADSRLIPVNRKEDILERVAEATEVRVTLLTISTRRPSRGRKRLIGAIEYERSLSPKRGSRPLDLYHHLEEETGKQPG